MRHFLFILKDKDLDSKNAILSKNEHCFIVAHHMLNKNDQVTIFVEHCFSNDEQK